MPSDALIVLNRSVKLHSRKPPFPMLRKATLWHSRSQGWHSGQVKGIAHSTEGTALKSQASTNWSAFLVIRMLSEQGTAHAGIVSQARSKMSSIRSLSQAKNVREKASKPWCNSVRSTAYHFTTTIDTSRCRQWWASGKLIWTYGQSDWNTLISSLSRRTQRNIMYSLVCFSP